MSGYVIAIDGPAGAGKSTVAKLIAGKLGMQYLDTGAMYRAVALLAQRNGLDQDSGEQVDQFVTSVNVSFGPGTPQTVFANGEDVTADIRKPEIGELASALSVRSAVRRHLVAQQQLLVASGNVILEGRDVTTVVAPSAHVKVYMTASLEERAQRRTKELDSRGTSQDYLTVRKEMQERDNRDITRDDSPLTVAPEATVIETAGLSPEQVAEKIIALVHARNVQS